MPDAFDFYFWSQRKLTLHGSAVEIECACDELVPHIDHLAQPFREEGFPDGFVPIRGMIEPYHLDDVLKHLPPRARRIPVDDQPFDLYRDGDRYFRVDETIGLTLVDIVRRRWHSWVMEDAMVADPVRVTDAAVHWPLAQLMARRGVQIIPGVALAKDNFGALLIGELSMEPELTALLSAGYRLIGQRWVALQEEAGGIAMLHLPGHVQQKDPPAAPMRPARFTSDRWIDFHARFPRSMQNHAFCDLVLVCGGGRREQICVRPVGWAGAMNVLRRAWPIADLPPLRRGGKLVAKIASQARVAELQLSREPRELLAVLEMFRSRKLLDTPKPPAATAPVEWWVRPAQSPLSKSA